MHLSWEVLLYCLGVSKFATNAPIFSVFVLAIIFGLIESELASATYQLGKISVLAISQFADRNLTLK